MKRVLLSALLLGGCTVGPDYAPPQTGVPPGFAEPASTANLTDAALSHWWDAFGDPTLSELVNRAVAQNLDVQGAAARIREARAQEQVSDANALPQLSAQGSVTRQRISENAIPAPPGSGGSQGGAFGLPGSEFTTWRAGFDASWEIDLFGRNRRAVEAARGRSEAALWDRRDAQVVVAAETASAYLRLRTAQQRIAVAEAEVERQQRALEIVNARLRGGLVTEQEAAQHRSSLASAKAAIAPLRAQAAAEIHALGVLTGTIPEALIAQLSLPRALPNAPEIPAGLPSELLRRRPDIRAAERNFAAATADIGVATADLYPRFSLTAAPALVSTALGSLLEWGSRAFTAGTAVDWPLFDGGRTKANIAVADARQNQALIAYRKSVLTALKDVEDALSSIENDRQQLANLSDSLGAAHRAEDLARTRYRGGLVTFTDVLQAQAGRIALEGQVVVTKGTLARHTVALTKALGGGWPELGSGGTAQ